MKKFRFLAFMLIAAAAWSCADSSAGDEVQPAVGCTIIVAPTSIGGSTRAIIKDDFDDYSQQGDLVISWKRGDKFSLEDEAGKSVEFTYKNMDPSDRSRAIFQCSDVAFAFVESAKYKAVIGSEPLNEYTTLGNSTDALCNTIFMTAEVDSYSSNQVLEFVPQCAVMRLEFNVGAKPKLLTFDDEVNNINIDFGASGTAGANYAYLALRPLAEGESRTITMKMISPDSKEWNYSATTTKGYNAAEYYVSDVELSRDGIVDPFGYGSQFTMDDLSLPGKKGIRYVVNNYNKIIPNYVVPLNVYWNYSWGAWIAPNQPDNIEFVPMQWSASGISSNVPKIEGYIAEGKTKRVLGYNEPDGEKQANMSVDRAIELWPKLETLGVPLGSPATVSPTNSWMTEFWDRAMELNYRVDYICIHSYGGGGATSFLNMLESVHKKYGRPLLITEFAVADWGAKSVDDNKYSREHVLKFMKTVLPAMEKLDYVLGYAWFPFASTSPQGTCSSLYNSDGSFTILGEYYSEFNAAH